MGLRLLELDAGLLPCASCQESSFTKLKHGSLQLPWDKGNVSG